MILQFRPSHLHRDLEESDASLQDAVMGVRQMHGTELRSTILRLHQMKLH